MSLYSFFKCFFSESEKALRAILSNFYGVCRRNARSTRVRVFSRKNVFQEVTVYIYTKKGETFIKAITYDSGLHLILDTMKRGLWERKVSDPNFRQFVGLLKYECLKHKRGFFKLVSGQRPSNYVQRARYKVNAPQMWHKDIVDCQC